MIISGDLEIRLGQYRRDWSRLTRVDGRLLVCCGATLLAPALTSVGGSLYVYASNRSGVTTLDAPALTSVGGWLVVGAGAMLNVPALARVGGRLCVQKGAALSAPGLVRVDSYFDVAADAALDAPALAYVDNRRIKAETVRVAHQRRITRYATAPHAQCAQRGRCVEPVPKCERCC